MPLSAAGDVGLVANTSVALPVFVMVIGGSAFGTPCWTVSKASEPLLTLTVACVPVPFRVTPAGLPACARHHAGARAHGVHERRVLARKHRLKPLGVGKRSVAAKHVL